jgi:hypothetical protein
MYTGPISCSDPYVDGAPGPPCRNKTRGAAVTLAHAVHGWYQKKRLLKFLPDADGAYPWP